MIDNVALFEQDDVVSKYADASSRTRCLNNAEKLFIDAYDIKNKNILVLGSGVGRVPANLQLFGNRVTGVELSSKFFQLSEQFFPPQEFPRLSFHHGNALDLNWIDDGAFDVVFFPQNGIDYISTPEERYKAIGEMARVCRFGGLVAFSTLNLIAYCISYKLPRKQRAIRHIVKQQMYREDFVLGGGYRYMAKPSYMVSETQRIADLSYLGFTADVRNGIDFRLAKRLQTAAMVFPWLNYVFKKK